MAELETPQGGQFTVCARVHIRGKYYDMDALRAQQAAFVADQLNEQGLNAALAGRGSINAAKTPPLEEVFPDLNE
ncbi:MAG: hypothetical protein LUG13_06610 [Oscillospiraceae bacterium]|nr:hypothetical protein [Oscillospiraceae bacterium]